MPVAADTPFGPEEPILALRPDNATSDSNGTTSGASASAAAGEHSPAVFASASGSPSFPGVGSAFAVGVETQLAVGRDLFEMPDSSALYRAGDLPSLVARLERDGYVLLRGLLPRRSVLEARRCVCEAISHDWNKIDLTPEQKDEDTPEEAQDDPFTSTPLLRARIASDSSTSKASPSAGGGGLVLTGFRGVTHDARTMALLEGEELATLFAKIFGELRRTTIAPPVSASASAPASSPASRPAAAPAAGALASPSTFDTKWVRVHGRGEFTDEHTDYYRFEHWEATTRTGAISSSASEEQLEEDGARGMYTCWIPLGSYPLSHGTLVVAEGTHRLSGYSAGVYDPDSRRELPPDFEAWRAGVGAHAASGPGKWRSAAMRPGDAIVFDLRVIHASTHNSTDRFRISMDTRWKPTDQLMEGQKDAFRDLADKVSDSS